MQTLPLIPSVPSYRVGTVLEGIQFIFDLHWNAREGAWYMDVSTEDDVLVRAGVKLTLGLPVGARVADDRFPQGGLYVIDTTGNGDEATLDDLGDRVVVMYLSTSEIEALYA